MQVKISHATFDIKETLDLTPYQGIAKYLKKRLLIENNIGVRYFLSQRDNGTWFLNYTSFNTSPTEVVPEFV